MASSRLQDIHTAYLTGVNIPNLFIQGQGTVAAQTDGIIFFKPATALMDIPTDCRALAWQSSTLYKNDGTGWSTVSGGGGSSSTWDDIYLGDKTLTLNSTTLTFNLTHATNDGLTLTGGAATAGSLLQFTNSGSGYDVAGTSATWFVTSAGAPTFQSTLTTGNIVKYGAAADSNLTINAKGSGTVTINGTATGAITLTRATTCSAALTVGTTLTVGIGATFSAGPVEHIDVSNIAAGLRFTNDTITTYGNAANAGAVVLRSASMTTGTLLHLALTEAPLAGGYYFRCWATTAGTAQFTIAENGVTTIAGAGASAALTVTAGDVAISDGSITMIDADDATSFSLVNNANIGGGPLFTIQSSGANVGTTTSSFVYLKPSGLTTGTALYLTAAAATTSVGVVDVISASLTSGSLMRLTTSTAAFTTGGKALEISLVSAVAGNGITVTTGGAYTGTGLAILTAGAMTTGVLLQLTSTTGLTTGSLLRATTSTAGALNTNGIISLNATGDYTSSAVTGSLLNVAADTTAAGNVMNLSGNSLTSGVLLNMSNTGAYAGAGLIALTTGTTTGTIALITANAFTTGVGLSIASTSATLTTGSLLRVSTSTTGAVATNGVVEVIASGNYTSTANVGILNLSAAATTAGTILNIVNTAMTSGVAINVVGTAAYVGTGLLTITSGATTGTLALLAGAANVSGFGLKITATAATLTTGRYLSANDGALEVFGIGANGHIHTAQTTAPTIAVTQQNGITAAAITAGATDVAGIITTTGTNNNGGTSILQITFHKTYTTAPKAVILTPRNASAAKGATGAVVGAGTYVSAIAATTFDITIPADAAAGATPSWNYVVIS